MRIIKSQLKLRKKLKKAHNSNPEFPGLDWDFEYFTSSHYCAFYSMSHLTTWFDGWLEELKNNEFYIAKITVKEFIVGESEKQILYHENDVIEKEFIELLDKNHP